MEPTREPTPSRKSSLRPRVERRGQHVVQLVHGARQFAKPGGRFAFKVALLRAFRGSAKTSSQSRPFVGVPQQTEQAAHHARLLARRPDRDQSRSSEVMTLFHAFEQGAFKLAAVLGPVGINAAQAAIKGGARLRQALGGRDDRGRNDRRRSTVGRREEVCRSGHRLQGLRHRQPFGRLQFHISEDHAVAAKTALEAYRLGKTTFRIASTFQDGSKLGGMTTPRKVAWPNRSLARTKDTPLRMASFKRRAHGRAERGSDPLYRCERAVSLARCEDNSENTNV